MLHKICRIAPNTANWEHPTKKEKENPKAFTAQNGFGYEDWLNRKEWTITGFSDYKEWRYIHIPSLSTKGNKYNGEHLTIFLYVKRSGQEPQIVGMIHDIVGIGEEEAEWAMNQYEKAGWTKTMKKEVENIGGNTNALAFSPQNKKHENWTPLWFANVKFTPENLVIFKEPRVVSQLSSYYYNTALNCDSNFLNELNTFTNQILQRRNPTKTQVSEAIFITSAIEGKIVHPKQAPIQNYLYKKLSDFYKPQGGEVLLEDNCVDLTLHFKGKTTLIEIKPAPTAKQAIRQAIGQLLEYAHYPSNNTQPLLIIVNDIKAEKEDIAYLELLSTKYKMPIKYICCSKGSKLSDNNLLEFSTY